MLVTIYVRLRKKIVLDRYKPLYVTELVEFSSHDMTVLFQDKEVTIKTKTKYDDYYLIDGIHLLHELKKVAPNYHFELIGPSETVVRVKDQTNKKVSQLVFLFVWLMIFVGTAMTIINFHYDVSMQEVHTKIHYVLTGEKNENPLWIQIPYSIGLGIGMLIFLNRFWKKRINDEPSPLEIEMYKYERDIDDFIVANRESSFFKEEYDN